jgi:5-methylcytosine-specific restriction protein A
MQLAREPLCRACAEAGMVVPATDVDHIQRHNGDLSLMFSMNNTQSLCHSCHSRKTMTENNQNAR